MTQETIALITGATRGMGREIAKELAAAGQTVLIGSRKLSDGEKIAAEILSAGGKAEALQLDVTDSLSVEAAAKTVADQFGYLSILINNAGVNVDERQLPSALSLTKIRAEFDVNFFGLINVTQTFLPLLKKASKAKILIMSSMMGSIGSALNPETTVYRAVAAGYQASKAAVNMYNVQLAKELGLENPDITVNLVDPGLVATEFAGSTPELTASFGGKTVEEGVRRMVELALTENLTDTATYTNTDGVVPW